MESPDLRCVRMESLGQISAKDIERLQVNKGLDAMYGTYLNLFNIYGVL